MMNYEEPRDVKAGTPQQVQTVEDSNVLDNSINIDGMYATSVENENKSWSILIDRDQNFNSNKQTKSKTILITKSTNGNEDYR